MNIQVNLVQQIHIVSAKYTCFDYDAINVIDRIGSYVHNFDISRWFAFIKFAKASDAFGDPFPGRVKQLTITLSDGTLIKHDEIEDRFTNIQVIPLCKIPTGKLCSKIYGFYHISTFGDWKNVVSNQILLLKESGLYDKTFTIFYSIVGPEIGQDPLCKDSKFVCIQKGKDASRFERSTIQFMRSIAILESNNSTRDAKEDIPMWYIHSKGVTKSNNPYVKDWIDSLNYFTIQCHDDMLKGLETANVSGINWNLYPEIHFSGNFWWARSSYIRLLSDYIREDYLSPEFWIAGANPVVYCPHDSGLQGKHYVQLYPRHLYVKWSLDKYKENSVTITSNLRSLPSILENSSCRAETVASKQIVSTVASKQIVSAVAFGCRIIISYPRDFEAEREVLFSGINGSYYSRVAVIKICKLHNFELIDSHVDDKLWYVLSPRL